jgi:hypothetical protein
MLFLITIVSPLQQDANATELQPIIRAQPTPRLPLDIGAPGNAAELPEPPAPEHVEAGLVAPATFAPPTSEPTAAPAPPIGDEGALVGAEMQVAPERAKLHFPDGTYEYIDQPGWRYYIGADGQEYLSSAQGIETVNGESFVPEEAPLPVEQQVFPQPETWSQFPTATPTQSGGQGYCGRCGWRGKP